MASPVLAVAVSVFIQGLKKAEWFPWMTRHTERLNLMVTGVIAFLSALAITVSFDFDQETGRFAAGMSGNIWDTLHVILHAPVQWAVQHAAYKTVVVPSELLGAILRELKNQAPPPGSTT